MTKPGDQFVLRKHVFARIRDLFEREGIEFASREVRVRVTGAKTEEEEAAVGATAPRAGEAGA